MTTTEVAFVVFLLSWLRASLASKHFLNGDLDNNLIKEKEACGLAWDWATEKGLKWPFLGFLLLNFALNAVAGAALLWWAAPIAGAHMDPYLLSVLILLLMVVLNELYHTLLLLRQYP